MKKRITWLANRVDYPGGIERVICILSNYLHDSEYEVKVVSLNSKTGRMPFDLNKNIKVEHLAYPLENNLDRKQLKAKIKSFLENEDSDILITCHPWIAMPVLQCKKSYRGKIICTDHATWESYSKARRLLNAFYYRRADKLVLLTKNAQNIYRKHGVKNTLVIPNTMPAYPPKLATLKSKELIAAGRLTEIKGFDRLIKAIDIIRDDFSPWHLTIYGDGEEEQKLKQLIKENNLQDLISLKGFTDKLLDKFLDCSGFIVSSHSESFSMVTLEALSSGVPTISFDIPAIREIDNNSNTIIFAKQGSIEDLAIKISSYINDDNRAARGKASRKISENYSIDHIGPQWIKLIESL